MLQEVAADGVPSTQTSGRVAVRAVHHSKPRNTFFLPVDQHQHQHRLSAGRLLTEVKGG
jgi:hypothetical protein